MLNKKLVALAVIFSLLAAGSVYLYLRDVASKEDTAQYVTVLSAAQDIGRNTVITEVMLEEAAIPEQYVQAGALTKMEDAVGKVALAKIFRGQQVLGAALIDSGSSAEGLAYTIPSGKRAVSVAVDEVSALDGMMMPGDKVDVAVTMDFNVGGNGVSQTSIIIQNIQVLAVGRKLEGEGESWLEREGMEKTVTLAVTPAQAQSLILASERGSIRMLLRTPSDSGTFNPGALQTTDLLRGR